MQAEYSTGTLTGDNGGKHSLLDRVDLYRIDACRRADEKRRAEMGQFLTPIPVAKRMARAFETRSPSVRLIDAGAGVGALSAAFVDEAIRWKKAPEEITIVAYELDPLFASYLHETLALCQNVCKKHGIRFCGEVIVEDFIAAGVAMLQESLFSRESRSFNYAILNPPYRKINSTSETRHLLRQIGIETSNLYTAFVSLAARMLDKGGEMVAITPRSFCNGPYFKPFRKEFLEEMTFRSVHVFESRNSAFRDDEVLQENIIFQAVKGAPKKKVTVSSSHGAYEEDGTRQVVEYNRFVHVNDPDYFIHIVPDHLGAAIADRMSGLTTTLDELGIRVSTGRVVDFRARESLRKQPGSDTAPLIYPGHFYNGFIKWPLEQSKKPNALAISSGTKDLLLPTGTYVLVKRFSAKEEPRRVVAAIYEASVAKQPVVAFENHLNYFHKNGKELPSKLARGLAAYLNSTLVDAYFRQFNGHTQVNATDLRSLRYPSLIELESIGSRINGMFPQQQQLDRIIEEELFTMAKNSKTPDPIQAKHRIDEALTVLKALGLPKAQQNDRSALTLLALLDVQPIMGWADASAPLRGITQMMEYFAEHYGKAYAPNSRETVRRQTVHQFMQAGLIIANPDRPERPINSGKTVYQITPETLRLLRSFGTKKWERNLKDYLSNIETLTALYNREREMRKIPVTIVSEDQVKWLSPGGQNILIKEIVEEFCPRFTPGGKIIYIGDADSKFAIYAEEAFADVGITFDEHGKMPDIVVHYTEKDWLVLIEAVTSHGPVNAKRHRELAELFSGSNAGLVYVTAFLTRKDMGRYLGEISWETEVWVAESPSHLIHFNGERFLGPYEA